MGLEVRFPPDVLPAEELQMISQRFDFRSRDTTNIEDEYRRVWQRLIFKKTKTEYPGETPDHHVHLISEKGEHSAMYNHDESIVFFSFVPEIGYGWLNGPGPGGWTQPLYYAPVTDSLLQLIGYQK